MAKCLLAAGIVRDILFDSLRSLETYLLQLWDREILFEELERYNRSDGKWILRIVTQYNATDLIQL